jgi:hypothetical protein
MNTKTSKRFEQNYAAHLQHLKLKGLQPKTIDAYARAIRRFGARFDGAIDTLTEQQLLDYFTELLASHSWSAVKLDLYGLKFCTTHVLRKPCAVNILSVCLEIKIHGLANYLSAPSARGKRQDLTPATRNHDDYGYLRNDCKSGFINTLLTLIPFQSRVLFLSDFVDSY